MLNDAIPNLSISFEKNFDRGITRLAPDEVSKVRFADLMNGMKQGLSSSATVLSTSTQNIQQVKPQSLQEKIIRDVTSLENGFSAILEVNNDSANEHMALAEKHEFAASSKVLFDYQNFSARYFVATNYASGSAQSTSEEIQIFTKSK
jgi:hypothetical protein